MNVCSLELAKELFELSGWDTPGHSWHRIMAHDMSDWREWKVWCANNGVNDFSEKYFPAYDLGFLIRKLPIGTEVFKTSNMFGASVGKLKHRRYFADSPEDATAMLAIELIKQGILKP